MSKERAFDPFGDYDSAGHLRNVRGDKDPSVIKQQEHNLFRAYLGEASQFLKSHEDIRYEHFLQVHKILFGDYYPWAGQDRSDIMPHTTVAKGPVRFAARHDIRLAVERGLELAENAIHMRQRPGEIMGLFAYGHPFLDGNGRTMMVVFAELCERAGFFIDWSLADAREYLEALTQEIQEPGKGVLDAYMHHLIVNQTNPSIAWHQRLGDMHFLAGMEEKEDATQYGTDEHSIAETIAFEKARNYSLTKGHPGSITRSKPARRSR